MNAGTVTGDGGVSGWPPGRSAETMTRGTGNMDENMYYRGGGGSIVHRAGCSALNVANSRAARWDLVAGQPFVDVMATINDPRYPWLRACKRCMKPKVVSS